LLMVINLQKYKTLEVNNSEFNFHNTKTKHMVKLAERAALEKARLDAMTKKVVVEVIAPKGPLVALTTEQLKKGHKLYGKCMSCHGKAGQGKKSQKAPRIGGQADWYIASSITKMKAKERINKVMFPYIKRLSAQDIKDLAAYISKLPW
jgi:cytochrome c553